MYAASAAHYAYMIMLYPSHSCGLQEIVGDFHFRNMTSYNKKGQAVKDGHWNTYNTLTTNNSCKLILTASIHAITLAFIATL